MSEPMAVQPNETEVVVTIGELSRDSRAISTVSIDRLYNTHAEKINKIYKKTENFEKFLKICFTKGKTTKDILVKRASAHGIDFVKLEGFIIHVRNLENISQNDLTFPRLCAMLTYFLILKKVTRDYDDVIRSLGSGLTLQFDQPSQETELKCSIFNACLIPGSGFIPMAIVSKEQSLTDTSLICATAAIALDFKYASNMSKNIPDNIMDMLDNITNYDDDSSCLKQLLRQGFFTKLEDDKSGKKKKFISLLELVVYSLESNITKRLNAAIKKFLGPDDETAEGSSD